MVHAISNEILLRKSYLSNPIINTIYFGGGTPSLLDEASFSLIFDTIFKNFSVAGNAEITMEANPDDLTIEKFLQLKNTPINRLSIGIQSFYDPHLRSMNRIHTATESENSVRKSQDFGFDNISIDLIYALPHPDHSIWESDLKKAVSLNIQHISAYCLTIEPKTTFGNWVKKGKIKPVDEEYAAQQFEKLVDFLPENGFEQYEISNFSLPGLHAKHNTSYWQQAPYLGIGPSAHSYDGNSRQWNVYNNQQYIESISAGKIPATIEILSETDKINEYVMTGLRTKWGIDLDKIKELSGLTFDKKNHIILGKYIDDDLIILENNKLILTPKGKLLADEIAGNLFL